MDTLDGGAADRIEGGLDGDGSSAVPGMTGSSDRRDDEIHGNRERMTSTAATAQRRGVGGGGHDTFVECETIHQ